MQTRLHLRRWVAATAILAAIGARTPEPASAHGGFVDFAMLETSDAWPWMSPAMFNAERSLGNLYARVDVVWSEIERSSGRLDFSIVDQRMNALTRGVPRMRAIATVFVGRGWMTCDRPCDELLRNGTCTAEAEECRSECACCQRCPADPALSRIPLDLDATPGAAPDPVFGYSRSYYDFVRALMARHGDQIDYVVIENEINDARYWDTVRDPDAELYLRLLATAHKAVKDVDARIVVTDSGFGTTLYGVCAAKDLRDSGFATAAEVHELLSDLLSPLVGSLDEPANLPPLGSAAELASYLGDFGGCRPLTNLLATSPADAWSLHYKGSPRAVWAVREYLARLDPGSPIGARPVVATEIGCPRRPGEDAADEARCVFTSAVTAQALGVPMMVWSNGYDRRGVRLWEPDGTERPAAATYRMLATTLGARFRSVGSQRGPEVFRARFFDAVSSEAVIDALWSWDGEPHAAEIAPNFGYFPKQAVDYLGSPVLLTTDECGRATMEISEDPVLVYYERPIPARPTCTMAATPSPSPTPTPTLAAGGTCTGDCNGDGRVSVDEVIVGVRIGMELESVAACAIIDRNGNGVVTVDELVTAVRFGLDGCPDAG